MNFTVRNADLVRELNLLDKIVGKKPTIPVLANVLLQAGAGGLLLSATDLELGLIGACAADVAEDGAVTLPARKLMELSRAQSDADINFASDTKGVVKITSGRFKSRLQSLPPNDFPTLPGTEGHPSQVLPRDALRRMLTQVHYAVKDDARFFLNGACMVVTEDTLTLVCTDGHRISLTSTPWQGMTSEPVLIPIATIDELLALLAEAGETDLVFVRSERHLFFDLDGRLLISRTVDGKFPAYGRMIPKDNAHVAEVPRQELADVLRRLILIEEVVQMTIDTDALEATSRSAGLGDGVEQVDIRYAGPRIVMTFKGQYVLDFLNAATSPKIVLSLKDATTPMLFTDGAYLNVVMGMR